MWQIITHSNRGNNSKNNSKNKRLFEKRKKLEKCPYVEARPVETNHRKGILGNLIKWSDVCEISKALRNTRRDSALLTQFAWFIAFDFLSIRFKCTSHILYQCHPISSNSSWPWCLTEVKSKLTAVVVFCDFSGNFHVRAWHKRSQNTNRGVSETWTSTTCMAFPTTNYKHCRRICRMPPFLCRVCVRNL